MCTKYAYQFDMKQKSTPRVGKNAVTLKREAATAITSTTKNGEAKH